MRALLAALCLLPMAACLPWQAQAQYTGSIGRGDIMVTVPFTPCEVLLPVELLHFRAVCDGELPRLEWATATEHHSAAFVVERSTGSTGWMSIGALAAAGHSLQTVHYRFVDERPPLAPVLYYRLRQQDTDGRTTIMPTVALRHCGGADQGLLAYPNPADDVLWAHIPALEGPHWLELSEATGRMVRRTYLAPSDSPRTEEFPLAGIAAGIYQLSLCNEERSRLARTKVIKR